MDDDNARAEHFDLVLEAAGLDLWENDLVDGRVIRPVSRVFADLGYSPHEFVSTIDGILSIVHPDDAPCLHRSLDAHVSGEVPRYQAEFRIRAKSGDWDAYYARQYGDRLAAGRAVDGTA